MPDKKEDEMLITLKVDAGAYNRLIARGEVQRGYLLGLSPYFDDQFVLSPIDGTIERISHDRDRRALLVSIRQRSSNRLAA
jgi:Na+-translocating ferredoxin:NAD+ oxidoreductase RnfC subunit